MAACALLALGALCAAAVLPVHSFTSYANDFVNPHYMLAGNFSQSTTRAQQSIISAAEQLAAKGPWSVTFKNITPPSGDLHDYMSWAPYSWPDCSKAGNTTALTQEQIWTTCPYVTRDGQFNPDARLVNDVGSFSDLADAVFYNALAWALDGQASHAASVASSIQTWFIEPKTAMNPNLNYAQMARGPDGQTGSHEGVLDLKCMAKIVSGILILWEGNAPQWTMELDTQMKNWTTQYIGWLENADIAIQEAKAANNHGTFYYNQLAALQILVGDLDGARGTLERYYKNQFLSQISANGDQPLESARTRPYHYRAYNLAAMITNARLAAYIDYDTWNLTTSAGATVQSALNFAMQQSPGHETASELYSNVAAVAAAYGDANGKYAAFLLQHDGSSYVEDPAFLWDQPLSDSGLVRVTPAASSASPAAAKPSAAGGGKSGSEVPPKDSGAASWHPVRLGFFRGFVFATVPLIHLL
ncbi:chondroitin AC/alginate lyase [Obba rivulosa]|uniref:Chondroitin AC/alginate lyase n=1 Tax=Obba rivulosa TaxID=1052685 RepID=A0A8E2DIY4_9APHY|nr:chondroitin AC/alginate lyase [Obba rivulosa]